MSPTDTSRPTQDGRLNLWVMGDVPSALARLDAYGDDVPQVEYASQP